MSLWTGRWRNEVEVLTRLRIDGRVTAGRLVIDHGARHKNADHQGVEVIPRGRSRSGTL